MYEGCYLSSYVYLLFSRLEVFNKAMKVKSSENIFFFVFLSFDVIGHCELIISSIESNGDPHGL